MTAHELTFYGHEAMVGFITAACACGWSTDLENGHTLAELNRLAAQHTGTEQDE